MHYTTGIFKFYYIKKLYLHYVDIPPPYPEPAGLAGGVVTGPLPPTPRVGGWEGEPALFPTGRNLGLITKIKCRDQLSAEFKNYIFWVKKIQFFY